MRKQEPNDKDLAPATTLGAREEQGILDWIEQKDVYIIHSRPDRDYLLYRAMDSVTYAKATTLIGVLRAGYAKQQRSKAAQPQVAEGKEEPVEQSGWIKTAERPPTKEDADEHGEVIWRNNDGSVISEKWDTFPTTDYWMPIPPVPRGQQKDLGER